MLTAFFFPRYRQSKGSPEVDGPERARENATAPTEALGVVASHQPVTDGVAEVAPERPREVGLGDGRTGQLVGRKQLRGDADDDTKRRIFHHR